VHICYRLDGLPLATELAAARVKALSVEQIDARLDDQFRLLTGGSRTALPRQQTLRALIDWSHNLLDEEERILLRRLSIFAGGWTLEAAEAVCAGEGVDRSEVLDLLTQLVNKSLVIFEEPDGHGALSDAGNHTAVCKGEVVGGGAKRCNT
jgi:predicted ATPase